MKKVISFALALLLVACCAACQPTPDEEVITQRDGEIIEDILHATPQVPESEEKEETEEKQEYSLTEISQAQLETYLATLPEHWSDYIDTSYIQMPIEADIIVENTDGFPVYTVKNGSFDMELIESIANQMMPEVTGIREGSTPLPEEYAAAISSLNERGMVEYAEYIFNEGKEAPAGSYTDAHSISLTDEAQQTYVVRLGDGSLGQVYITGTRVDISTSFDSMIHLQSLVEYGGSYDGEDDVILNPSITQEQAEEVLNEFLSENELTDYCVERVSAGRHFAFLTREEISQGWRFDLVRSYGYYAMDVLGTDGGGLLQFDDDGAYSKTWMQETLYVYISENGIEYVQWNNPLEIVECVNPSVELMAFEEIQTKLKKLLALGISQIDFTAFQPKVSKLVLTVAPQQVMDDPDTAYLMPIWIAFVNWYYLDQGLLQTQILGINALDGSRAVLN